MLAEEYKLDNPVWHSLAEVHKQYAVEYPGLKFYDPGYCPFGGTIAPADIASHIQTYAALCENFFVVGNEPAISPGVTLYKELVCDQMIIHDPLMIPLTSDITQLTATHRHDLLHLVNLVQPGYFKTNTPQLGNYFGIYVDDELVAVTGERMKMNAFTEVSAVVTHPDHTGQGYAKQLVAHTVNHILKEGKTPFLHVAESNSSAIALYRKLGFVSRRKMSFWNIVK